MGEGGKAPVGAAFTLDQAKRRGARRGARGAGAVECHLVLPEDGIELLTRPVVLQKRGGDPC